MSDTSYGELAAALTDVRRSYRLLWAFQKRIFDYNKLVHERLGFAEWGSPVTLLGPAGQTGNTSWVYLPSADMEFRAVRRHIDAAYAPGKQWVTYPRAKDSVLYIRLRADTGMSSMLRNDRSPLTFDRVESCQTKLFVYIVLNRIDRDQPAPLWTASEACRSTPVGGENAVEAQTAPGYSIFGKEVDLAALPDEFALVGWIDTFKDAAEKALDVKFSELPDTGP
jgi:hypothetical protein